MADTTGAELLYEGYDDLSELQGREVTMAAENAPFRLPTSWRADRASRARLTMVVKADGGGTQTATAPVIYVTYRHGREELEVQVLDVTSPAARLYVDAVLSERPLVDVPAGRGSLAGRSFIIDGGAHLIRATYDDGGSALSSVHDPRVDSLQEGTRELLGQVQPR